MRQLLVGLAVFGVASCAAHSQGNFVRHVPQRTSYDCGVSVLAMATSVLYERAEMVAAPYLVVDGPRRGMTDENLARAASRLEHRVRPAPPETNLRTATGILRLMWCDGGGHYVYLHDGKVYDPERRFSAGERVDDYLAETCTAHRVLLLVERSPRLSQR